MPKTAEELLRELGEAMDAARTMKRQLHEEIQDAKAIVTREKSRITEAIVAEVASQIGELSGEARRDMDLAVGRVIDEIRAEWRRSLKLDP